MDIHAGARALARATFDQDDALEQLDAEGQEMVYGIVRDVVQAVMSGKPPVTTDDVEKLRQLLTDVRTNFSGSVGKYAQLNEAIGLMDRIQGRVTRDA